MLMDPAISAMERMASMRSPHACRVRGVEMEKMETEMEKDPGISKQSTLLFLASIFLHLSFIMDHTDAESQNSQLKETTSREIENVDANRVSYSPEEERALVRKTDLSLLPMIWVMYLLSYLDRTKCVPCCLSKANGQHRQCKDIRHGQGPEPVVERVLDSPCCFFCWIRGV